MDYLSKFKKGNLIIAPGIYDPLSAIIAEKVGFDFLYLSGASISYSYLGMPDLSFTSLAVVDSTLRRITDRVNTPVICDADTGYGNEPNVEYTVKTLERSGAAAIQLEDQKSPKRCGHLSGKEVLPAEEMVMKIKAALNVRKNCLIIARTDSLTINGIDDAIDRANLYLETGADIAFVEAPQSAGDLARIGSEVHGLKMANMVEGGKTPIQSKSTLESMGFDLAIYPGSAIRTVSMSLERLYGEIRATGTTKNYMDHMLTFDQLQDLLKIDDITHKLSL